MSTKTMTFEEFVKRQQSNLLYSSHNAEEEEWAKAKHPVGKELNIDWLRIENRVKEQLRNAWTGRCTSDEALARIDLVFASETLRGTVIHA